MDREFGGEVKNRPFVFDAHQNCAKVRACRLLAGSAGSLALRKGAVLSIEL